ncbi:MAG: ABC transporter substrate-binding protein [Gaiellaceae bacterium]|jgi:peptide/nickel transport system substrate-binding protein
MNRRSDLPRRRLDRLGGGFSRVVAVLAVVALTLGLVAWTASTKATRSTRAVSNVSPMHKVVKGKKGGTLKVLMLADVDTLDPGAAYYSFDYEIVYPTQRPLYSYAAESLKVRPDMAASLPKVTNNGKTVTVKIRKGVRFSPPVKREVTSKDVKYAIERGFATSVANGYAYGYFGALVGSPNPKSPPATPKAISGITTPDKYTIVFHLKRRSGALIGALVMPLTAPVPKSYAAKFDNATISTYGQHQVATGPYMIKNDKSGSITCSSCGYKASQYIKLVRNPSWKASTDFRPAYLNGINLTEASDQTVATDTILAGGADASGDFGPPPTKLASILSNPAQKKLLFFTPTSGTRDVALNTTKPPFNNLHVRRAVAYILDRNAMRQTRGGPADGEIATHFISPDFKGTGFEAAGGYKFDPFATPGHQGSLSKALAEMKQAAPSMPKLINASTGMYIGPNVSMVSGNATVPQNTAQVVIADLKKIGIGVDNNPQAGSDMYAKFCNVPANEPAICPNVGWLKDFNDAQTILDVTFSGKHIPPTNNSNWGQLNDPKINADIAAAEKLTDPKKRAVAWGKIDDEVTQTAVEVPWIWEDYPTLFSARVNPARQFWNQGGPDFSSISIK